MAIYPNSMTDSEWNILETLLPPKTDTLLRLPQDAFQAEHCGWHSLHHPDRWVVADEAQRSAQSGNLLSRLPAVGHAGKLGESSPRDPGQGPPRDRKKSSDRCDYRQSKRSDSQPFRSSWLCRIPEDYRKKATRSDRKSRQHPRLKSDHFGCAGAAQFEIVAQPPNYCIQLAHANLS